MAVTASAEQRRSSSRGCWATNRFRTAVPFRGQTIINSTDTQILSSLPPKRDHTVVLRTRKGVQTTHMQNGSTKLLMQCEHHGTVPLCGRFIFISATWCQKKRGVQAVYTPNGNQYWPTKFPICENPTKRGLASPRLASPLLLYLTPQIVARTIPHYIVAAFFVSQIHTWYLVQV